MTALSNRIAETLANTRPQVCVLDHAGSIIAVSETWKQKAQSWGLGLSNFGIGEDYLSYCKGADGAAFRAQLSILLSGETDKVMTHYDCGKPGQSEPFVVVAKRETVDGQHFFSLVHMSTKDLVLNDVPAELQEEINSLLPAGKPAPVRNRPPVDLASEFVPVVKPLLNALDALLDAHRMSTSVGDYEAADRDLKMILQIAKQIDEVTR